MKHVDINGSGKVQNLDYTATLLQCILRNFCELHQGLPMFLARPVDSFGNYYAAATLRLLDCLLIRLEQQAVFLCERPPVPVKKWYRSAICYRIVEDAVLAQWL